MRLPLFLSLKLEALMFVFERHSKELKGRNVEAEGRCERMLKIWREEMVLQVWHAESQGLREGYKPASRLRARAPEKAIRQQSA